MAAITSTLRMNYDVFANSAYLRQGHADEFTKKEPGRRKQVLADMERTVGMPALALIHSGGLLFVRAANEGRTVIEMFPREKISEDFDALADRIIGTPVATPIAKNSFGLFNRPKVVARA